MRMPHLCLLASCLILSSATPAAALTATIRGTVSDETGAPISGHCIELHRDSSVSGGRPAEARTRADGTYAFSNVSPGRYLLYFAQCDSFAFGWSGWAPEWHGDVYHWSEADPIEIGHLATAVVDARIGHGAQVTGTVTEAGAPVEGICVRTSRRDHAYEWEPYRHLRFPISPSSRTRADGTYIVRGIVPGTHIVRFDDCRYETASYVPVFYPNAPTSAGAAHLDLTEGITPAIDQVMDLGATVFGTVTIAGSGPYDEVCVRAYDAAGVARGDDAYVDGDGNYRLQGIPPVDARIGFAPCYLESELDAEYHPDVRTLQEAARLTIGGGNEMRIDASLTRCETPRDEDGDGLSLCEERAHGTWPDDPDTDGDLLSDGDEVHLHRTRPDDADTDGDLFEDGTEVNGTECRGFSSTSDPLDPTSTPAHPDGVGAPAPPYTFWPSLC